MRGLLYGLILTALLFAPVERLDVAKLEPVQAVAIYKEDGMVILETDTEDKGRGKTAIEALQDMKKNTASVIYLDTAEYLLVSEEANGDTEALRSFLKPSVKVSAYIGGSVGEAAKYADVHGDSVKLKHWKAQ